MQKKHFMPVIIVLLTLITCSKKNYTEYKVYPVPGTIKVAQESSSFIAIKVEIPQNYHIYGNPKGPGIGRPTEINIEDHKYIKFETAKFLNAEKYFDQTEKTFTWVFKNETTIFIPFRVAANAESGTYEININYSSLLCSDTTCIPKDFVLPFKIEIVADSSKSTKHASEIINLYEISKSPTESYVKAKINGKGSVKKSLSPLTQEKKIVLDSKKLFEFENFQPRYIESSNITSIIEAIIFGLIAGFILNFMPCVLPVVSLKMMSFVKYSGEKSGELSRLGILFSLGILTSFTVLAALAAFMGYNWGDLFQHREFIIVLTAIVFVLALSMFDIFTINVPSIIGKASKELKNHKTDAYVKGILATLLATPCSGPFLGGTLAWALTQPPLSIFIIFISVGTGMALPYLAIAVNPGLVKFIPKPGEWMRTFEHVMGFLLIFTVVYLTAILDNSSTLPMITFLAFLSIGFWQYGKFGNKTRSKKSRLISVLILPVFITGGYLFSFNYIYKEKNTEIKSIEFSLKKIYENKNNGRISIVKFTADWCPNCKLVEKLSIYTKKVSKIISENKIDLLVADLTRKNPPAKELMIQLKARSIPFLAIIPPGRSFNRPICLRDIYTEDDVLKAIKMAINSQK